MTGEKNDEFHLSSAETAPNVRGRLAHKQNKMPKTKTEWNCCRFSFIVFRSDAVKTKKVLIHLCGVFLSNVSKTAHSNLHCFFLASNGKRKEDHCASFSFLH